MNYHLFRIFLVKRDNSIGEMVSRNSFLKEIFGNRIDFISRGSKYVYIPIGHHGDKIVGRIGKSIDELVNEPPEQAFDEKLVVNWKAANIAIDTSSEKEGQILAIQKPDKFGFPTSVAKSLADHINSDFVSFGWKFEINAISSDIGFWNTVDKYKGKISRVNFVFVTPNILNLKSSLNEGLKEAREANNAQTVQIALSNSGGGLELEKENIKDGVEYVSRGGGRAKINVGNQKVYDSEEMASKVFITKDEPITKNNESFWEYLLGKLFK